MAGTLYLIGTGPGDPELLTLKAVRLLGLADVIAYPQKHGAPSLSFAIAKDHLNPHAERLPVAIPMEIDRAPAQKAYDGFAAHLLERLRKGKNIAYLCEGDPLFYGSAMYLISRIAGSARVCVVPGVTSLTATAAALCRPIAARNDVLKILPAPLDDERLLAELRTSDSVAVIKVGRHFERVRRLLEKSGHGQNAMIVEHATGEKQKITPLLDFLAGERPYFSTILSFRGASEQA